MIRHMIVYLVHVSEKLAVKVPTWDTQSGTQPCILLVYLKSQRSERCPSIHDQVYDLYISIIYPTGCSQDSRQGDTRLDTRLCISIMYFPLSRSRALYWYTTKYTVVYFTCVLFQLHFFNVFQTRTLLQLILFPWSSFCLKCLEIRFIYGYWWR